MDIQDFFRSIFISKNKNENYDFNDSVLNKHIVPTTIYSNNDVRSFAVKPRSIWHLDAKRSKPINLDKITGNGYSINDDEKQELILGRIKRK